MKWFTSLVELFVILLFDVFLISYANIFGFACAVGICKVCAKLHINLSFLTIFLGDRKNKGSRKTVSKNRCFDVDDFSNIVFTPFSARKMRARPFV